MGVEVDDQLPLPCLLQGKALAVLDTRPVLITHLLVRLMSVLKEFLFAVADEAPDHNNRPGSVQHVNGVPVMCLQLHCCVHLRSGGTANQKRNVEPVPLHLLGHRHHLVQAGCDETGQPHNGRLFLADGLEDLLAGGHHPQVDHVVVVAPQHHPDDVLPDVVNVALDSGQHDGGLLRLVAALLLLLHEGNKVCNCLLHHTGRLDHLRQEHLTRPEEVPNHRHPGHEGAFDDVEAPRVLYLVLTTLFNVLDDVVRDTLDQGVLQPLGDVVLPPLLLFLGHLTSPFLLPQLLSQFREPLGAGLPLSILDLAVENRILTHLTQLGVDVLVHGELTRVHNSHVHPALVDRIEQKARVHCLPDLLHTTEGEGKVRETTRDLGPGKVALDPLRSVEEVHTVVVVLLEPGGDRQNVGIEDDVLGREVVRHEDIVSTLADADLVGFGGSLPVLIESHHHHSRTVPPDDFRMFDEGSLTRLERDGVHDGLPLDALQPRLDHCKVRTVHHEGDPADVGVGDTEVEELGHGLLSVDQPVVQVEVEDHGALLNLLPSNAHRRVVVPLFDDAAELQRSGDVAPLADVHESRLLRHPKPLQSTEHHSVVIRPPKARWVLLRHLCNRGDVCRPATTAPTHHVDEPRLHEVLELLSHLIRRLIVLTHGVRKTGVRVGADVRLANLAEPLHVGAHSTCTKGTVKPDREDVAVTHGGVEGLCGLPRQGPPRRVGDGTGDHDGDTVSTIVQHLVHRVEGCLGVECVEDGFDEQNVDLPVEQRAGLLHVTVHQLIVRHVPVLWLLNTRRDGGRPVRGPDSSAHVPLAAVLSHLQLAGLLRQDRCLNVDARGKVLHLVVRLGDLVGVEGVCLDEVGPSIKVLLVHLHDQLRPGKAQQVVVSLEVARPVLELLSAEVFLLQLVRLQLGPCCPIQNTDAGVKQVGELLEDRLWVVTHCSAVEAGRGGGGGKG
eukprot:Sspe_Gene.6205::Locus_2091_Transcript_1_2_Confidence_0.750_Length_3889::g.6205::m.6205